MKQKIPINEVDSYKNRNLPIDLFIDDMRIVIEKRKLSKKKNRAIEIIIKNLEKYKKGYTNILLTYFIIQISASQIYIILSQPDKPPKFQTGGIVLPTNKIVGEL